MKKENHDSFFFSRKKNANFQFYIFAQTKPNQTKKNALNKHHGKYRKTFFFFDNHNRALFSTKKKIKNKAYYQPNYSHIDGDDSSSSHRFFFQHSAERIFMMYTHNERIYFQHRFFSNKNLLLC